MKTHFEESQSSPWKIAAGKRPETPGTRPIAGAIRWDAWHGDLGTPGQAVERSLAPKRWRSRLPFFSKLTPGISGAEDAVAIQGATQDVMDQEIAYARRAGLDYWAFVTYPPDNPMSLGLEQYLASTERDGLNFCLVIEADRFGPPAECAGNLERFVALMAEPSYQKVLDGRPLLYITHIDGQWVQKIWGSKAAFGAALDYLRALAVERGLGNPYIVIMEFFAEWGGEWARELRADAISAYAKPGDGQGAPYADLAKMTEEFWAECAGTGSQVVPIVMAGWDRRPRVERPVPWERHQKPGEGIEKFYQAPTPAELTRHLAAAVTWVRENSGVAEPGAIIIYAWNENDEGGWLVPTLDEGTARIDAIACVLKEH